MEKLKALFLVATLKQSKDQSHTHLLSDFLAQHFENFQVDSEFIRLIDYNIEPGVYTIVNADDWPMIFKKIMASDIIIFATPVWWGTQSSLMQRVIERLDEVHDDIMKAGKSKLANKVAGIIVTGDSDGAEHIIGNLTNFFVAIGLINPPFGNLTVLWSGLAKNSEKTKQEIIRYFDENYTSVAKKAARNISFMANLLNNNPFPEI